MFQALKKLTRRVLKGFGTLLPLLLATPAMAQWGAETTKVDTSRFINGAFSNGLIMPHQQVIVGLLDTTITSVAKGGGNASKIIVGSLLDYEDNCVNYTIINGVASCAGSYEQWRELEKSTSWYQAARGDTTAMFPTNYAITISTGNDSLKIWNRDTAESWMAFLNGSNFMVNKPGSETISDITFKDGTLRVSSSGTTGGVNVIDFLNEKNSGLFYNSTGGPYIGTIQERNTAKGYHLGGWPSALLLVNRNVNGIAVVRDPFGLKDDLGRPKHWWNAATAGGISTYNPHKNSVYDSNSGGTQVAVDYTSRGASLWVKDTTHDEVIYNRTGFDRVADDYGQDYAWSYGASGVKSLPSGENYDYGAFIEGGSIVGRNEDVVVVGGSFGTYLMHQGEAYGGAGRWYGEGGAKVKITAAVNTPVQFGDCVLALALETNTVDSTPYGNTMTANNSPGTATAVFGQGYSSTVSSYLTHVNSSEFAPSTTEGVYVSLWFKSHSTTNPAAAEFLFQAINAAHDVYYYIAFATDGTLDFVVTGAGGTDTASPSPDIYDNEWHHIVLAAGPSGSGGVLHAYIDGVDVATDASTVYGDLAGIDDVFIGAVWTGGTTFTGLIDDVSVGMIEPSAATVAAVHAEGRKKLALSSSYPSPVFSMATSHNGLISNNVVDIDALDNGMWAVVFSDAATAQVFDGRIPIQQVAAPAGTVKSVALIQSPGTDSVGVAIGTTTNLKFVQPSVNLRAAMEHQYKEPIHVGTPVVVDSAGIDGIFWTGTDGIVAANNAGLKDVLVSVGTYGSVIIDHDGMTLRGSGVGVNGDGGTLLDGDGANDAVNISANHVTVRDLAYYTAPSGGGGNYHGIIIESGASDAHITNTTCRDADNNCISVQSAFARIIGNNFTNTDNWCIWSNTNGSTFSTNIMNDIANGILITTGDGNVMAGNIIRGGTAGLQMDSGGNYNVFTGNKYSGNLTDNGTGNIKIGNEGTSW